MFEEKQERFLELFKERGWVTDEQIDQARKSGTKSLHKALIDLDFLSKDQVYELIAEELGVAYIDLRSYAVEEQAITAISEDLARKFKAVPIFVLKDSLGVAMADPRDVEAMDRISMQTGLSVEPFLSAEEDIMQIVASGDVSIQKANKKAWGQKATYDRENATILLEGSPVLKQGRNFIKGEEILVRLDEDRMDVKGSVQAEFVLSEPEGAPGIGDQGPGIGDQEAKGER